MTTTEGFGKQRLFEMLDSLEQGTRGLMESARAQMAADNGDTSLEAWNLGFAMAGDVTAKLVSLTGGLIWPIPPHSTALRRPTTRRVHRSFQRPSVDPVLCLECNAVARFTSAGPLLPVHLGGRGVGPVLQRHGDQVPRSGNFGINLDHLTQHSPALHHPTHAV